MNTASIVVSLAGRDKGGIFFVVRTDEEFAYIVDGKARRTAQPKRKRKKHLKVIAETDAPTAEKIRSGDKVPDSEIRRALKEFEHSVQIPGGNETWQKTM